jgi:hypothetical protein
VNPYLPPKRMVKWPFSPFQTIVMMVIPPFQLILAFFLAMEVFCLLLWAALFLVGNAGVAAILLVTACGKALADHRGARASR